MTLQMDLIIPDVCEGHHGGNPESRAAFDALLPHLGKLQQKVLQNAQEAHDAGSLGITVKSVRHDLQMEHQTASARLCELKKAELLAPTDTRIDGCRVLQITELGRRVLKEWQRKIG